MEHDVFTVFRYCAEIVWAILNYKFNFNGYEISYAMVFLGGGMIFSFAYFGYKIFK